jgi:hypothetical protein
MPESEEYIRGMWDACTFVETSVSEGYSFESAIRKVKLRCVALERENVDRIMKRIEWPDGGGR